MFAFLWSLGAFIVALGILVAVHEWGHFYVARRCGVKVERFSIGFGKPLWRRLGKDGTEYVIAAIPLGGYVRMLDERVDQVKAEDRHRAFNNQSLGRRMAIIAAGPGVNFLFAILALWLMYSIGIETVKPVVGEIQPSSIAAEGNLEAGDTILAVGNKPTSDWESVNLELVSFIGDEQLPLQVRKVSGSLRQLTLDISHWQFDPDKESALGSLGFTPFRPEPTLTIGMVGEGSPADEANIQVGDVVKAVNGKAVDRWEDVVAIIQERPGETSQIDIVRENNDVEVQVKIGQRESAEGLQGYLGVSPEFSPWPEGYVFTHHYGPIDGFIKATDKTWRLVTLSVQMIGKLVTGDVSVKSLSGPISIAQGAGVSAGYGLVYFLSFLALISVNLGIINLLPLPMLDGGHLMYYMIELITGKPVPEKVQEWGFRIGGMLLFTIMSIAIFNDISRIT
ncbi:sigma E protease regulator RseP [Alteromonas ponticola]|uniref:Zinc metalloprotease n=1 Tax=Alteromonas aquimaris TaxID=2998417 RepID=A0ABT3P450_9ALTE|nr:sigma E protease regulator RseP [Alteromonas aquimaris]MCW8107549.1 sigma E protease regulator RseP [Alteromonas aquimaris]